MKIMIVSRSKQRLSKHIETVRKYKRFISDKPEVIIALGGDGTFLAAERFYPGIPKLLVRDDSICNKCDWNNLDEGIKRLLDNQFTIKEFNKLKTTLKGIELEGANDIVIRNVHPTHAIRFRLLVNNKIIGDELIGDGIVVSTVFGSEGYFRSITKKHFEKGLGVAFNNITTIHEPLFIKPDSIITIQITRGIAHVAADNNPVIAVADKGDKIVIRQSRNTARIIRFQAKLKKRALL
ncbi:hypothetical protein HY497_01885 [Candidatus Woesearchaeota archaeon]|nr:hypothetical protein [Candidatus Woesearchaeota archaeon]